MVATSQTSSARGYATRTLILIAAWTVFRLFFCTTLELIGDEAYYFQWSKHLDWSYYSKGPGVAWTIATGTRLFGDTVFGIRFFAVVLGAGTAWGLYQLGSRLFSPRVGFWTVVAASFMPLFVVGSVLMTIDALSVFFWTMALLAFWRARQTDSLLRWGLVGLLVGAGALAKYTNLALIVSFLLFCLSSRPDRKHLLRPTFWVLVAMALLCMAPVVIWNAQRDWITVRHLVERGELTEGWQFRPDEFLEYVGQQFGVAFPLYLVGMFVAFIAPDIRRHFTTAYRFLLCMSAPLYLFYTFLALNDKGQPNWTVPSLVGGLVIMTAYWLRRSDESRPWRRTATVTLCLAGLVVVGFLVSTRFRMPTRRDPLVRARGSRDLAAQVVAQADEHTADFILGANYQVASLLTFYLPDHPAVYPPHSKRIKNQFAFWPSYGEAQRGQTALYVSKGEWVPPELTQEFARVELIEKTQTRFKGKRVRDFYFYLCEDYSGRAQPDHNRKARP